MSSWWLILLLPSAAFSGWLAAWSSISRKEEEKGRHLFFHRDYLVGLNFLLNEESDKAIDCFIKMLEVDSDTVETHLALGNLFRRRGEVNRAIRIHQNLIARPELDKSYKTQALFALARDYFSAGVLDRAERLFLELVNIGEHSKESLDYLLDIYQQEKEWEKATEIAEKLKRYKKHNIEISIAHHYCELSELETKKGAFDKAEMYLKDALSVDKACVRASLLIAKLQMEKGNYNQAIRFLHRIKDQDSDFLSEAIMPLVEAYRGLSKEKELVFYFKDLLKEFPKVPIALMLSERIRQWRGDKVAAKFVTEYVREHPSIEGLARLVELQLSFTEGEAKQDLIILHGLIDKLLADQPNYRCVHCGFAGKKIHWQCPGCKRWSVIKPTYIIEEV